MAGTAFPMLAAAYFAETSGFVSACFVPAFSGRKSTARNTAVRRRDPDGEVMAARSCGAGAVFRSAAIFSAGVACAPVFSRPATFPARSERFESKTLAASSSAATGSEE